jgi:hypothetical protein
MNADAWRDLLTTRVATLFGNERVEPDRAQIDTLAAALARLEALLSHDEFIIDVEADTDGNGQAR